jgi:hypothetical protein
MIAHYHRQITLNSLNNVFSPAALETIIAYNLKQDSLRGLIGHPEYHFDDSRFAEGNEYVRQQRHHIWRAMSRTTDPTSAWQAFGRITHAVQDFYAHSNYAALWVKKSSGTAGKRLLSKDQKTRAHLIDPLDSDLFEDAELRSGRIYFPWEALAFFPIFVPVLRRMLPHDSHTWMNLDSPRSGALFYFAYEAARKRTAHEHQLIRLKLSPDQALRFSGM